jgi:peroxiredoxin
MDWLSWVGLALTSLAVVGYLVLLFVIHDFTYRTWLFDAVVSIGILLAVAGWVAGDDDVAATVAIVVGVAWFVLTRRELSLRGSDRLRVRTGDPLPRFSLSTTSGGIITDREVVAAAPALLIFYRGWWCPSHKAQLDEMVEAHERLVAAGLSIFACSVDGPDESRPVQERVGDSITILCGVPVTLLEEIGIRDARGAPWYDRIIFGAERQDISMPAAIVVDRSGRITYAYRSTRVDDRAAPYEVLASLGV